MPQICYFLGISIYVQFVDHNPPHIHDLYNGFQATYNLRTATVLQGNMSKRADRLIREWVKIRRSQLLEVWALAKTGKRVFPVEPLE